MFLVKFLKHIKSIFQDYKKRQTFSKFQSNALVGANFMIELGADIRNESGEPWRIQIGRNCKVMGLLTCKSTGQITVGDYTTIQDSTSINCLNSVKIGSFTGIADGVCVIDNNTHPIATEDWITHRIRVAPGGPGYPGLGNGWEKSESAPIVIGDAVWVGGNSTILKGVTIGDGSIVARGSVVTKDVEPFTIVGGNPAKKVKDLPKPQESISEIAARILAQ